MGDQELEKELAALLVAIEHPIGDMIKKLSALIKTSAENNAAEFNTHLPEMFQYLFILKNWTNANFYFLKQCLRIKSPLLTYYMNSKNVIILIYSAILLGIPPADPQLWLILSVTGFDSFDNTLNELKADCLKLGNKILKYAAGYLADRMMTLPINDYCKTLYNPLIFTLITITMKENDKLAGRLEEKSSADFIVRSLGFLNSLLKHNGFYGVFAQTKNILIVEVCMVLIKTTRKELETLKGDPTNFVSLAVDVCTKQSSKVPKTEATNLLEGMCSTIDGCLSFTVIVCCDLIKYGCSKKDKEPPTNSLILSQICTTSVLITKTTNELLAETALLILADLSYTLHSRKDIQTLIDTVFTDYADLLFNTTSQLIKCRLAIAFRFYGKNIFEKRTDLFERMIKFLFNGVALEHEQMAFALQCADALKSATEFEAFRERIKPYIKELAIEICKLITFVNAPAFYDLVTRIVDSFTELIESQVINLMNVLVARVSKEYEAMKTKGINSNMTINQCWNVIRAISEQERFYPTYLDQVETSLLPLFEYMVRPKEIDFDDDIVQVITSLIGHRKGISENIAKLFPHLINFFEKYERMLGSLLQTLNAYICYGKDNFMTTKENIEYIIKICLESLFSTKSIVELNNSEGAILLQILLQTIETKLMAPYIPIIIENLLKRLDTKPSADYLTRQINNAILCSICNNPEATIAKIEELKCTELVFLEIAKQSLNYKLTYEVKVLTLGLSTVLLQTHLPDYLETMRITILSTIVEALTSQTKRNNEVLIKADKRGMMLMDDDSDEDDLDYEKEEDWDDEV